MYHSHVASASADRQDSTITSVGGASFVEDTVQAATCLLLRSAMVNGKMPVKRKLNTVNILLTT